MGRSTGGAVACCTAARCSVVRRVLLGVVCQAGVFIYFIDTSSARLGVLVWFYFNTEIFEYLKWSRSKHQSKCNQRILKLFK